MNFNLSKALQVLTQLTDGWYIDDYTSKLTMILITYNPLAGLWAYSEFDWEPDVGGQWSFQLSSTVVDLNMYFETTDHLRAVLEVILILTLIAFLASEFREMRDAREEYGAVLPYLCKFENWLDLGVYSMLLAAGILWVRAYAFQSRDVHPHVSVDAYTNFFAPYNLLAMQAAEQARYEAFLDAFSAVARTLERYQMLVCSVLLLMVLQLITKLAFHPRLGVISRTIANASYQLGFFFILFFFVTIIFTVLGFTLFGFYFEQFGSLATAFESCLFVMLGDTLNYDEMIATAGLKVMTRLWYWLYVIVVMFVLLNALLAIIVDGYTEATAIEPFWREPLNRRLQILYGRLQAQPQRRDLYMSNATLLAMIQSVGVEESLSSLASKFSNVANAYSNANEADPKLSGAARMLRYLRDQDYQLLICGNRVSLMQLTKILHAKGIPRGLDEAIAINMLLRVGVPSAEFDDVDIGSLCKSEKARRLQLRVSAYAFLFERHKEDALPAS